MKLLTELNTWTELKQHALLLRNLATNPVENHSRTQASGFKIQSNSISLDFSNQHIDETAFQLLLKLAGERQVKEKITALFCGDTVNQSEQRPALHTALRSVDSRPVMVGGHDIMIDIHAARAKMWSISSDIRSGCWLGYSGRPITGIVNIGVGGSDFGPRFCLHALADYAAPNLTCRFVSDVDPNGFERAVTGLQPETTLFIISSKSFTTQETLYNAQKALAWIGNSERHPQHFIAVTAHGERAKKFGISTILPIWDWVGGRFSLCSAINLITCIAIGYEHFSELLAGANSMDRHFQHRELQNNMPVIMALTGLWNINFLHTANLLMLVYATQLEPFVPYVQQLDMESNGKSVDTNGKPVTYATGPIVWGGPGNQAQHSYYQLLCQGTHKIAADFISTHTFDNDIINSLCDAKIRVLTQGIKESDLNGYIAGGMPVNHIRIDSCSPFCLGELVALYEHKIYVQGVLWNINSFDQPGVDSAKRFKGSPVAAFA